MSSFARAKAQGSDMTQPADAKQRVQTTNAPSEALPAYSTYFDKYRNSTKTDWAPRFATPMSGTEPVRVEIDSHAMRHYFRSLRTAFLKALYPDMWFRAQGVITRGDWEDVCRYLTLAKCDLVSTTFRGTLGNNTIQVPNDLHVPASLARVIDGLGVVEMQQKAVQIYPSPEGQRDWIPDDIDLLIAEFAALTENVAQRGLIRTTTLSTEITGTPWYTVGVIDYAAAPAAAMQLERVRCVTQFPDTPVEDLLLAAIVQRGFVGDVNFDDGPTYYTEVNSALAIRHKFATNA